MAALDGARYELAYASQRETKYDRALRRARKLRLRLGGDPTDDEYPDKPPRMRWTTYNGLLDKKRMSVDTIEDIAVLGALLVFSSLSLAVIVMIY